MMKDTFATRLRNINLPLLAGLLLLASCSQDGEPVGEALPDGQYPLQIASVTLDVEGTEQPWTRITETADGSGSTWQGGEQIGVRIANGEPGTYTMQGTYTQGITIQGDGITVVMDGATVSTSGIGINVQSDATIQVQGAGNTITSGSAGIYVAEGSTVYCYTGTGDTVDKTLDYDASGTGTERP